MILWKCCTQYESEFGKLSGGHRTGKGQFSFQSLKNATRKNAQTTTQLHSSHMLAKSCSKFSKTGFNSMWTVNFQMFKLDLERQKNQISNCQYPLDHRKSKRVPEKTYTSPFLTMPKFLTLWTTTNCGKFFKRWEYQTIWPASWELCMQIRKQQMELDMERQTGSK